jgi:hypothetical protein
MAEYAIGVARPPDAHGSVPGVTFRDKADIADLPLPAKDGDMARKMAVSGHRVRCLARGLPESAVVTEVPGAMARALDFTLRSTHPDVLAVGQVHPSLKRWFAKALALEREVFQTPTTISSDIFPMNGTMVAEALPPDLRSTGPWRDTELEDTAISTWHDKAWTAHCMVSVRAGNVELLARVVHKAKVTAAKGKRCLVVLEVGHEVRSKKCPAVLSTAGDFDGTVQRDLIMTLHKGYALWAGSQGFNGAWALDGDGNYQADASEGSRDVARSMDGDAGDFNENRLEAILYSPKQEGEGKFRQVTNEAVRELVVVVANTAAPMPPWGRGIPATLHRGRQNSTDLCLRDMSPGADFDPTRIAREWAWQPTDGSLTQAAEDDAVYLQQLSRLRNRWEHQDPAEEVRRPVVCDGVVPTALVDALQDRGLPEGQRSKERHWQRSRGDAIAGAARVVAGRMHDVVSSVEEARATQVACLLERLGAPLGSLGTAYTGAPGLGRCMACSEQVSKRWHVGYQGAGTASAKLIDKVCAIRMEDEPATAGPDLDRQRAYRRGEVAAPPPDADAFYPWRLEPGDDPQGRKDYTRRQQAREAAREAARKHGVKVCFSCAQDVAAERLPGFASSEDRAFFLWSALANASKDEVLRAAEGLGDPDVLGRALAERGFLEQNFRRAGLALRVITVGPSVDSRQKGRFVAFVREPEEGGVGVTNCQEMELHSVKLWMTPSSEPGHASPDPRAAEERHELDTARRVRALAYQGHPSLEAALGCAAAPASTAHHFQSRDRTPHGARHHAFRGAERDPVPSMGLLSTRGRVSPRVHCPRALVHSAAAHAPGTSWPASPLPNSDSSLTHRLS